MSFTSTNHLLVISSHQSASRTNLVGKLFRILLVLSMLSLVAVKSNAQWWFETRNGNVGPASAHFKTNFQVSNGYLHIEVFARNPEYNNYGGIGYGFWIRDAQLAFTTDDVSYTNFYRWGVNEAGQWIGFTEPNPYSCIVGSYTTPKKDLIITFDLPIDNATKHIRNIRISGISTERFLCCHVGDQNFADVEGVTIPTMSPINQPVSTFITVQNKG